MAPSWNRYPGLMCDIESYIYLPLLEKMDYMPKRKYASGHEIRLYAENIATKFGLHKRATFQTCGQEMTWDEEKSEWNVKLRLKPKGGNESDMTVRSDFVCFASGVLSTFTIKHRQYRR
jgi:cation diffusion facilitator CzcD-associated flavoprotein CzcO